MASSGLVWSARQRSVSAPLGQRVERIPDFQRLRLSLYGLILAGDGAAMAFAFLAADLIRFGRLEGYGLTTFIVLFPTYVAVALNGDTWSIASLERPRYSAGSAIRAFLFATAVATVFFFSLKVGEDFSRLVFGIGSFLALGSMSGMRLMLGRAIGRKYGWNFRREIMIVDGVQAAPAGKEILVEARSAMLVPALDDPLALDRLGRLLDRSERAIVACPPERREAWTRVLAGANVDVEILAPELSGIPALGLRQHGTVPSLLVGCGPLRLRNRAFKRLLDLSVATAGLVLFAPLMLLIAVAIRLESVGPALFKQNRMGRGNRIFTMLKFRTMHCEAADGVGARSVRKDDERVTRIGHLLRRTSLDELPQIVNVLRGEMSIVGPRPHALGTRAGDQFLWAVDERYWDRHAIKPGLTGLAQVRGLRGATETTSALTDRLQADLEYIDGWHIGRDIAIMLRTLVVLIHPNAF